MSVLKHIVGVYKTCSEYKINSFSKDQFGILYSTLPAFRIASNASKNVIIDSITQALESSCLKIIKNGESTCGKQLLHFWKEKSWSALYRKSTYCELCVFSDFISLHFHEYSSTEKSLIYNEEKTIKFDSNKILEAIEEMLRML